MVALGTDRPGAGPRAGGSDVVERLGRSAGQQMRGAGPGAGGAAQAVFWRRLPTASTAHFSSGNLPSLSFEYTRSPLTDSSKHPPPAGISFSSRIRCLYVVSSLP